MGGIEVVAVEDKKALREFIEFPYVLYRDDPYWVPPLRIAVKELLDRRKHPYYANADVEFFLARQGGRTVGRIAGIVDHAHNRFHEEKAGFFGFYESVDDGEVARALLARARGWVFDHGAQVLRGPVNPSTNYECGMLIEGFDASPVIMMTYNPRYYPVLMEQAGLCKAKDLLAYYIHTENMDSAKIDRVADRAVATNGVRVRPINMKDFDRRSGEGLGGVQPGVEPQLGLHPHVARGVLRDGQGDEADPETRTGADRRGGRSRGGIRSGLARY